MIQECACQEVLNAHALPRDVMAPEAAATSSCTALKALPQCEEAVRLLPLEARRKLACQGQRWQQSLLKTLEQMYNGSPLEAAAWAAGNNASNRRSTRPSRPSEPEGHRRFDALMPAVPDACALGVYGRGDGAKRLCGLERMPRCVAMSIGSRGDIRFESDLVQRTNCTVEIFDCTVPRCHRRRPWPEKMRTGRVRYHRVCVAARDSSEDSSQIRSDWGNRSLSGGTFAFRTYASILAHLQLSAVTLLKMDIEGFEYDVLSSMLRDPSAALPSQLAFELHYSTQMTSLRWRHRERTAGEMALLARAMYDAGYRTLSRVDNWRCPHCAEFTMVRLFCPDRGAAASPPVPPPAGAEQLLEAASSSVGGEKLWGSRDPGEVCVAAKSNASLARTTHSHTHTHARAKSKAE